MKFAWMFSVLVVPGLICLTSCQGNPAASQNKPVAAVDPEEAIRTSLAKLGTENRLLAERQRYCPVMPEIRLGEMGTPFKVVLKGVPFMVCCQNCVEQAQENPDITLSRLKSLQQGESGVVNKQVNPAAAK